MRLAKLIAAAVVLAACGDSPGGQGSRDAGADAPAPAPYDGLWRLTSATFGSDAGTITMTDENQQLTDPEIGMHLFRINGTLELGGGEIAYVQQRVVDDAIPLDRTPQIANFVTRYTASGGNAGTFALTGFPTVGFVFTPPPDEKLEIDLDLGNKLELHRTAHTPSDALAVRGRITLGPGTPTFTSSTSAHVSIAFLLRGGTFGIDPRDDEILDFTGTDNVTFELDRTEGALGTQRIMFGPPNTAIAVGLVIVWDDVDGNGMPSSTLLDKCTLPAPPGSDCLRGVSPIYIAYRSGSSPELSASPYAYVREGWTQNLFIQDLRGQFVRDGMVSLDATRGVPFDVYVPPSPMQTFVPAFDF